MSEMERIHGSAADELTEEDIFGSVEDAFRALHDDCAADDINHDDINLPPASSSPARTRHSSANSNLSSVSLDSAIGDINWVQTPQNKGQVPAAVSTATSSSFPPSDMPLEAHPLQKLQAQHRQLQQQQQQQQLMLLQQQQQRVGLAAANGGNNGNNSTVCQLREVESVCVDLAARFHHSAR
jgi:hypothetical protein